MIVFLGQSISFLPLSYHQTKKKIPLVKISEIARGIRIGASTKQIRPDDRSDAKRQPILLIWINRLFG